MCASTDDSFSLQKAVNCCAEVVAILDSGPDGGNCPEAGNCRGFNGTCADVVQQFADVPILPEFPAGLADYTCDAFPMDSKPVDRRVCMLRMHMSAAYAAGLRPSRCSFIVGLISLAVGLPVVLFLQTAFAIANDSEAPESWLEWPFTWRKLVFGFNGATLDSLWILFSLFARAYACAIHLASCSAPPVALQRPERTAESPRPLVRALRGRAAHRDGHQPGAQRGCCRHLLAAAVDYRGARGC